MTTQRDGGSNASDTPEQSSLPSTDSPHIPQTRDGDRKLLYRLRRKKMPSFRQFKHLPKVLPFREKLVVAGLVFVALLAGVSSGAIFYVRNFTPVPVPGGTYTEGLVGAPQYINPLLSQTNDVDTDISRLIFSGLLAYDRNLQLVPDLAESYQVSDDQLTYTFRLLPNLVWHDSQPLTADDVVFTFKSIQDPAFKSPLLISFRGVETEKVDELTVKFTLPEVFPEFLEVMTAGLLPEHIWGEIPPLNANLTEYNLRPIGAGAWRFKSLTKDRLGNIRSITLTSSSTYPRQQPYLEELIFKFYPDFQTALSALKNRSIEGMSFLPKELKAELRGQPHLTLHAFHLPQFTAIFFNQQENDALKDKNIRQALAHAIDKPTILTEALQLEGELIDGPILPGSIGYNPDLSTIPFNTEAANALLDATTWKRITTQEYQAYLADLAAAEAAENEEPSDAEQPAEEPIAEEPVAEDELPLDEGLLGHDGPEQEFYRKSGDQILTVVLTTVDQNENTTAASLIQQAWQSIGVRVELEIIPGSRITRDNIKPRDYEALLFGEIVGPNSDPYPFWHSSQNQDPGLNLAVFNNRNADKLLEDARATSDDETRHALLQDFQEIIIAELPAIFLYSPTYSYVVDERIKGIGVDRVLLPADRFNNIADWYTKTRRRYIGNSTF